MKTFLVQRAFFGQEQVVVMAENEKEAIELANIEYGHANSTAKEVTKKGVVLSDEGNQ